MFVFGPFNSFFIGCMPVARGGAREGAVVAVVWDEMRRIRFVNCCWYAHSDEGALLLMFEDEDEEAFESIESFFLRDVVDLEDDFVLRWTDLEKRVMNFAPPPLVLRFE